MRLLFEGSAPVRVPLGRVRELIDDETVLTPMLGDRGRAYVDIDHRPGVVGLQGHWWYRGEISADVVDGRTVVTYRVFNIAERAAWSVPLANRLFIGYGRQVRETAAKIAQAVEAAA